MHTETKTKGLAGVRQSTFIRKLNAFVLSPWMLGLLAALTVLTFIFSLELYYYTFVLFYGIYVTIFADDLLPLVPVFILCYVAPSMSNNPGTTADSVFYGSKGGIYILVLAAIAVAFIFARIATDKNMGFKRLFCEKRSLLWRFKHMGVYPRNRSALRSEHPMDRHSAE